MPYYVFQVQVLGPVRRLQGAGVFEHFQAASEACRKLRAAGGVPGASFRMVFADNALQAEELLSEVRPAEPNIGDDY